MDLSLYARLIGSAGLLAIFVLLIALTPTLFKLPRRNAPRAPAPAGGREIALVTPGQDAR